MLKLNLILVQRINLFYSFKQELVKKKKKKKLIYLENTIIIIRIIQMILILIIMKIFHKLLTIGNL